MPEGAPERKIIPARPNPRIRRVISWYVRKRLASKRFGAIRLARGTGEALAGLADRTGPVVVCLNHTSWWDPLTAVLLAETLVPGRTACGPIDRTVLENVPVMGSLGLFGVDPDDPEALEPMVAHVSGLFAELERPTLWITPQGNFADVREPIRIRPGVSVVCARAAEDGRPPEVVSASVEYGFWDQQLPELFVRLERVGGPDDAASTTGWHRSITRAMRDNAEALAGLVRSRDPDAFVPLLATKRSGTHPVYEWWLRLTGRSSDVIATRREGGASGPRETAAGGGAS